MSLSIICTYYPVYNLNIQSRALLIRERKVNSESRFYPSSNTKSSAGVSDSLPVARNVGA